LQVIAPRKWLHLIAAISVPFRIADHYNPRIKQHVTVATGHTGR
jgi:hypothetical protein